MICPYCNYKESKVTDKRTSPDGIRRRRECLKCKKRFTTYERIERTDLYVIKKDGRREKFDIKKLEAGIEKALEKRPIPQDKINKMISAIDEQIRKAGKKEVKSSVIGELVMKKLKKLDDVAYVRFASVYRQFQDINDFKQEVNEL
ncbi:MAG: transcriptional regulator NrdR [Candidatus Diapherotrites archaeon ADurb.Bin253]|jgi:transcriptional repressor NrdR|nr:transcriptional repressor NrdR [Candidatus Pacearchaeota archaeon]OQA68018.1 MAG: transcriptional regulator NrdR [Candidatus Diapherotrites archaeon ADurb.Bin253]HNZ51827.1 transcriptional regulator NrdR [Candidatus Pacearchaeota archaeon]HOF44094.1 transcriptional regulator NrdR [Candidatus Pacearchaeota archaeon]HOH04199.1 transcriptional regulator NrdR [Candidatus Pacearchaeota archaeon]